MSIKDKIKKVIDFLLKNRNVTIADIKTIKPNKVLNQKHIIITGASRGIGYAIAKRCILEGAEILITGRNEKTLIEVSKKLGNKCKYLVFDVENINDISKLIKEAIKIFDNKIDCLVSNAGINAGVIESNDDFHFVTEHAWDKQMNINLKGNYFLLKAFVEYWEQCENTKGNIVVISSNRSKKIADLPYAISKYGVNNIVKGMSRKAIEKGIRINGVAPGTVTTTMTGYKNNGINENIFLEEQAGKRAFLPEEIAEVVNFLLSDASACISGEIIACDQGSYIYPSFYN